MAVTPGVLTDLLEAIKAAVEEVFAEAGVDLPERRFIANGLVAFDCPQLAVELVRVRSGLTTTEDPGPVRCVITRTAEIRIWLTREVPSFVDGDLNPAMPAAADLEASAEQVHADAWLLSEAVHLKRRDFSDKDGLSIGTLDAVGPEGGHGGVVQHLRVTVPVFALRVEGS